MEKDEKILRVKSDLRNLRKLTHSIEVSLQVKARHEKRLAWLKERQPTKEVKSDIEQIEKVLATLDIEKYISKATAIEAKYMEAINKLEPFDKTIILDGYINGKAYWKIGRDIGYTERGVQKRVSIAIELIASYI